MKNLRGIFKAKSKTEIMNLIFAEDLLTFKGEINSKFGYEIKTSNLNHYGNYLSNEDVKQKNFAIYISLRHILSLLKICEMIEGNVSDYISKCLPLYINIFFIVHGSDGTFRSRNLCKLSLHPFAWKRF